MANDNKNKGLKPPGVVSSSFSKGLFLDSPISIQPEGTYRWALNAIQETESGELGFISNEVGNFDCANFGEEWAVIGGIYLKDSESIVFLAPAGDTWEGHGKIVKINKDCSVTTLIWSKCLNFKINKQIQAVQRILNGCEINIYFTDNNNDIRHINVYSLEDYLNTGLTARDIDPNNPEIWDCEKMKLWPDFDMACINFHELNESGALDAGVYQFAIQYLDRNLNSTNWSPISQPIPVYLDNVNNSALGIKGNTGPTNKAIILRLSNLDVSFSYIRLAVIPSTSQTGLPDGIGYIFRDIAISAGENIDIPAEVFVSVDRLDKDDVKKVSLESINTPKKIYQTAKTIAQVKNRLVLGNLKENVIDHAEFQKNANEIQVKYVTKTLSAEEASEDSVQSGSYYFDYRSYMRDEIYALAIVWIFKDGTETFAYHIPGREKDKYSDKTAIPYDAGDPNNPADQGMTLSALGYPEHNRPPANGGGWDRSVIVSGGDYEASENMNVHHYLPNDITSDGRIERWEVYNTAIRTGKEILPLSISPKRPAAYSTSGEMGYYECRYTRYPDTLDCDGYPVYPYSPKVAPGLDVGNAHQNLITAAYDAWKAGVGDGFYIDPDGNKTLSYEMDFIRHHRMPDTTLEPHQYGDRNIKNGGLHGFAGIPHGSPDASVIGAGPKISTLGIKVLNIVPPAKYANLIQGWRIVKAEQQEDDKTVIDKGIVYYNHFAFKFWQGRYAVSGDINQCGWMQQGNYYNKHITSFACVHAGYRKADIAAFGTAPDMASFGNKDGQISIATNNCFCANYDENTHPIASGFTAAFGKGGGVGTAGCLICAEDEPYSSMGEAVGHSLGTLFGANGDTGKDNAAYMNMLTQQNSWSGWISGAAPYGMHSARNPGDALAFGQGYPNAAWGWYKPQDDCSGLTDGLDWYDLTGGLLESSPWGPDDIDPSGFNLDDRTNQEGINIGYSQDIVVYPNASISYHGPQSKFGKITNAEYVKIERILIGYTQNIICNTACCASDDGNGTHSWSGDTYAGTLTGGLQPAASSEGGAMGYDWPDGGDGNGLSGIGLPGTTGQGQRHDGNATYIYTRASFHHSGVPYSNISDGVTEMYTSKWDIADCLGGPSRDAGGNDSFPANAWSKSKYPIYDEPLCNMRIDDYMQLDAFQQVFSLNFGDVPFDNNTAMECMPISFKTKRNQNGKKKWFRLPYPGNNMGYNRWLRHDIMSKCNTIGSSSDPRTNAGANMEGGYQQFPLDSSFSLSTCDRLENYTYSDLCEGDYTTEDDLKNRMNTRGRITAYYVSIKKNSYDAYSNINSLLYHSTHNCIEFIDKKDPTEPVNSGLLFGGDSFISRFAFKHTQYNARCGNSIDPPDTTTVTMEWNSLWGIWLPVNNTEPISCSEAENMNYGVNNKSINTNRAALVESHGGNNDRAKQTYRIGIFNHLSWHWTESYINTELRTGTDNPGEWFYPYHFEGDNATFGALKFVDELDYHDTGWGGAPFNRADEEIRELPQSYTMNPDYNRKNTENFYLAPPKEFDFCNDCFERHPYRIAYSEQSFQEQQQDNYGSFLTENYRDIPSHKGEVWNMFELNNSLFIHTEESMWNVEPARNMVPTDESTIYIGTGDFFSEEVREIVESDTGYLGCQSQWATLVNEAGVFWPDLRQGAVYLQQKGPENISNKGLKNWFQENMKISIYDQYQDIYGEPFPAIDNPANPAGAGYLSVYDGRHNRLILTKKDYILKAPFNTTDPDSLYYRSIQMNPEYGNWEVTNYPCKCHKIEQYEQYENYRVEPSENDTSCTHDYMDEDGKWHRVIVPCRRKRLNLFGTVCKDCEVSDNDIQIPIGGADDGRTWQGKLSDIFECRNWTISYAILTSAWSSWHSYFPNFYLSGKDSFLSGNNRMYFPDGGDSDISTLRMIPNVGWKHHLNDDHSNYQSYYGCVHPHAIEMATSNNPTTASVAESLHFITDASLYKEDTKEYVDQRYTTFDSGYLYNSYQTTDVLSFTIKDSSVNNMSVTSITENVNSCLIDRKERVWGINGFRDMAIDRDLPNAPSLFSSKWEDIESEYYIDKVINPLAVDNAKNWFERGRLLDKYLAIRLFFSNLANPGKHKLVTNFLLGVVKQSPR